MYTSNSGLNNGGIAHKYLNWDLLTMLITVYSSKDHLILIWIFFLNYVRSFLKNRMQHLAETAPVDRHKIVTSK